MVDRGLAPDRPRAKELIAHTSTAAVRTIPISEAVAAGRCETVRSGGVARRGEDRFMRNVGEYG